MKLPEQSGLAGSSKLLEGRNRADRVADGSGDDHGVEPSLALDGVEEQVDDSEVSEALGLSVVRRLEQRVAGQVVDELEEVLVGPVALVQPDASDLASADDEHRESSKQKGTPVRNRS